MLKNFSQARYAKVCFKLKVFKRIPDSQQYSFVLVIDNLNHLWLCQCKIQLCGFNYHGIKVLLCQVSLKLEFWCQ